MKFAENLKALRREKNLSQEELAELLNVSRQAVSKWELGQGYPEVETLLELTDRLNTSLDWLMDTGYTPNQPIAYMDSITIISPHQNAVARCSSVISSNKMRGGNHSPQYALYGIRQGDNLGLCNVFLGWYANEEQLKKEMKAISVALKNGVSSYTLQYSVKTEFHLWGLKIIEA